MNRGLLLDIGAGTGNFTLTAAEALPETSIIHLEPDKGMNQRFRDKMLKCEFTNIVCIEESFENANIETNSISIVVAVHSLYVLPSPKQALKRLFSWLKPGGCAFFCDLGRVLDISDWRQYLVAQLFRRNSLLKATSLLIRGRSIAQQNRLISKNQKIGVYWRHTPDEFREAIEEAGFHVIRQEIVYRDYSDLIVAEKREGHSRGGHSQPLIT